MRLSSLRPTTSRLHAIVVWGVGFASAVVVLVGLLFDGAAVPTLPVAWTGLGAVLVTGAPSWAWGFAGGLLAGAGLTWGLASAAAPSPSPSAWIDVPLIASADLFEVDDEETFPMRKDALPESVDPEDVIAVDDGSTVRCLATIQVVRFYEAKPSAWSA